MKPFYYYSFKGTPSDVELAAFERLVGVEFMFYERLFRYLNGSLLSAANCVYQVPAVFVAYHEEYGMLEDSALHVIQMLCLSGSDDGALSLAVASHNRKETVFPFASDMGGNYLGFRYGRRATGEIVYWDHELDIFFPVAESGALLFRTLQPDPDQTADEIYKEVQSCLSVDWNILVPS